MYYSPLTQVSYMIIHQSSFHLHVAVKIGASNNLVTTALQMGLEKWKRIYGYVGVANGTSKKVGLEISEAFLISLAVSFLHGLFLLFLSLETFLTKSLGLGFYHSPPLYVMA